MHKKFATFILSLTVFLCVDSEQSILNENVQVTILDMDDDGKIIYQRWIPSASDIEQAESMATFQINGRENNVGEVGATFRQKIEYNNDYVPSERNVPKAKKCRSSAPVKAVVELVIVCDKEFSDGFNHNYQSILNFFVPYMWDVSMRYKTLPSSDISFRVNGLVVLNSTKAQPFIENTRESDGSADWYKMLDLYSAWLYTQIGKLPHFDMAPMFTNTKLKGNIAGLAALGSACFTNHETKVFNGAPIILENGKFQYMEGAAHEMGHNLGAYHDEEVKDFNCTEHGYLMTNTADASLRYFFSPCSDRSISDFLRSKAASCLKTLSSSKPILDLFFDNPKAPSVEEFCKTIAKNPKAEVFPADDGDFCKGTFCMFQPGLTQEQYYFTPVDNSGCSNDGGRCFRGSCRQPGQFFKSVGSGLCIQPSNSLNITAPFLMVECPSPGTPLDKLLVMQGKSGSMLASPFIMGREFGEKCGYTGNADGDTITADKCDANNLKFGWQLENIGKTNQFLLKHISTKKCAKPENNNIGSLVGTYKACDSKDNNMKWERF